VPEAGPDATADAPSELSDASDAGSTSDGAEAATAEGGEVCMAFDAGALDDAAVAAGMQFILSTGHCYNCHQTNPDAGILLSGNMNSITDAGPVYPPNLTPDPATGLGCWNNQQIANAILFGIDPEVDGGMLCRLMPKFGVGRGDAAPPLDDASVLNVVEFLRSLPAVSNEVQTTICPAVASPSDAGSPPPDANDGGTSGDAADAASE
jgi:mono/diheme cytochrome c family protein